jgi:hypothetical protein
VLLASAQAAEVGCQLCEPKPLDGPSSPKRRITVLRLNLQNPVAHLVGSLQRTVLDCALQAMHGEEPARSEWFGFLPFCCRAAPRLLVLLPPRALSRTSEQGCVMVPDQGIEAPSTAVCPFSKFHRVPTCGLLRILTEPCGIPRTILELQR